MLLKFGIFAQYFLFSFIVILDDNINSVTFLRISDCPSFRSILSAIGTPIYNLANSLAPIASLLTVSEFTTRGPFLFPDEIFNFDANYIMTSFDAERIFSNIRFNATIEEHFKDVSKFPF